jgi:hypothetical protein
MFQTTKDIEINENPEKIIRNLCTRYVSVGRDEWLPVDGDGLTA